MGLLFLANMFILYWWNYLAVQNVFWSGRLRTQAIHSWSNVRTRVLWQVEENMNFPGDGAESNPWTSGYLGWWEQLWAIISFLTARHISANHRVTQTFSNVHRTTITLASGRRSTADLGGSWTFWYALSRRAILTSPVLGTRRSQQTLRAWPEPRVSSSHSGQVTPSPLPSRRGLPVANLSRNIDQPSAKGLALQWLWVGDGGR